MNLLPRISNNALGNLNLRLPLPGIWLAMILLAAVRTTAQTSQNARDADKGGQFFVNASAAQAAAEKVFVQMTNFYQSGGVPLVATNLSAYSNSFPNYLDNQYWANYVFYNPKTGATNTVYVNQSQSGAVTNGAWPFQTLSVYQDTFRIFANAKSVSDAAGSNAAQAQLNVSFQAAPIFQFAVFYDGLMEFSDCATLTFNGPIHCNTNIYVGTILGSSLTFGNLVTTCGNITAPANAGFAASSWTGTITYNGIPTPGSFTNVPRISPPLGTNVTSAGMREIVNPPPPGENNNSMLGQQRYYNKAQMVLMIYSNWFSVTFKSSPNDASPVVFTNNLRILTNNSWLTNQAINKSNNWGTNWGWNWNWLSTTNTFYDFREDVQLSLTQIDVAKFTNWMNSWLVATYNTNVNTKFSALNPFDLIYVADWRYTNSSASGAVNLSAVRLVNGAMLPANGLTIATPNPMYIQGIYNCPNPAYQGTTNTTVSAPAAVICDALTILSPNWSDANARDLTASRMPNAINDTVNVAIIAGNVPSTGTSFTNYSGGAQNLLRLLENWAGDKLTMNTSLACLYSSVWANTQFEMPGYYYNAPTRLFSFDQNLRFMTKQPPGSPLVSLPPTRSYQGYASPTVAP